ncbi:MAG: hypothetical protein PHR35_16975 [Kiritimatiellae bacterium]|nr:hypothetical protein [Kiritimatiellia bacterium]
MKTRIGLWGCGNRTQILVKAALQQERIAITRCFDLDGQRAAALARTLGAAAVDSAQALLEAPDVDALLISLFPGALARRIRAWRRSRARGADAPLLPAFRDHHEPGSVRQNRQAHRRRGELGVMVASG